MQRNNEYRQWAIEITVEIEKFAACLQAQELRETQMLCQQLAQLLRRTYEISNSDIALSGGLLRRKSRIAAEYLSEMDSLLPDKR